MNKKMKRQKSILPGALGVRVIKTKQQPRGDIKQNIFNGQKTRTDIKKKVPIGTFFTLNG